MKIRKAIGAIILQEDECLLVKKVKIMDLKTGDLNTPSIWDFPKGGVKSNENLEQALFRELKEETGSNKYQMIKSFDDKISFPFNESMKSEMGFDKQETYMYLMQYDGDRSELKPIENEIADIKFVKLDKVLLELTHEESKDFFKNNIL